MNYWKNIAFIFLLIGIISCDNDSDDEIEFPVSYKTSTISKSKIKVYTKDGEVTNADSKDKFIQKYRYLLTDLRDSDVHRKIVATYLSKDTVELVWDNWKWDDTRRVYEENNLIYWEVQDTSFSIITDEPDISKHYKLKPLYYVEYDLPSTTFYRQVQYKHCTYVLRENGKLRIPMLDFVLRSPTYSEVRTGINNQFDESYLSTIGLNDTVMIQEYKRKMKK